MALFLWIKQHKAQMFAAGFVLGLVLFFLLSAPVFANSTFSDFDKVLKQTAEPTKIPDQDLQTSIADIIQALLSLVGLGFLILMIAGGVKKGISSSEENSKEANRYFKAGVLGIAVIGLAYGGTLLVLNTVVDQNAGPTSAADVGDAPLGCCMDKVSDAGILEGAIDGVWACRVTTEADCKYVGEQKDDNGQCIGDNFCGGGDWNWFSAYTSREECQRQCAP